MNDAFSDVSQFDGLRIQPLINKLASILNRVLGGSKSNPISLDDVMAEVSPEEGSACEESAAEDFDDDDDFDYDDDLNDGIAFPEHFQKLAALPRHTAGCGSSFTKDPKEFNQRIRQDLLEARNAGFKVAFLGDLFDFGRDSFVLVSCRVTKLGIQEDTLKAWCLVNKDYLMLMIHFINGYQPLEALSSSASQSKTDVQLHVAVTSRCKISLEEALDAFSKVEHHKKDRNSNEGRGEDVEGQQSSNKTIRTLFIGRSIDELMNTRLFDLINYRISMGISWKGAEDYYSDRQEQNMRGDHGVDDKYYAEDQSLSDKQLSSMVKDDHLKSSKKRHSFPLVAMQFMLRHVVRCTEFCLVCHGSVETDFEALKPFVCSKPLCLYQYMALGFGPSIEHEILTQPHVVDLLVSFCFCSASVNALKDLPVGMGLTVLNAEFAKTPMPSFHLGLAHHSRGPKSPAKPGPLLKAVWSEANAELHFSDGERPIKAGTWVCLLLSETRQQHRKVLETWYSVVHLGPAIEVNLPSPSEETVRALATSMFSVGSQPAETPPESKTNNSTVANGEVKIAVYDHNFDDLSEPEQQRAICNLLNTLPSVREMRHYLMSKGDTRMSLRGWTDRITPAAFSILRWIIASNRSCIIQIDNLEKGVPPSEARVSGMAGYVQFRFAQGAPDKEQRFIQSVRETQMRLNLQHPTIFAWHGSPIFNWHGIVREGLNYDRMSHGRAYGNGVYHSNEANTSLGYSGASYHSTGASRANWQSSELKIEHALCLNEIVNAPAEFVSRTPHLVVGKVDWIQTRYLFVKCGIPREQIEEIEPTQVLDQDPTMFPVGPTFSSRVPIKIPVTAISKSRRPTDRRGVSPGQKRSRSAAGIDQMSPEGTPLLEDRYLTDPEDEDDSELLLQGDAPPGPSGDARALSSAFLIDPKKTNFIPRQLDFTGLPTFQEPNFATTQATRALNRELQSTLKTQEKVPLHELGWFLDPDHVDNVYQWIVELHTFDHTLPLATDMKARDIRSVVCELRFGADYPYSPPFVRIIRPRFLPFLSGGGGHVTNGGALCMELLTNNGWNPASSIEAVLLQIRLALMSPEPNPARLDRNYMSDYGVGEAMEAFRRACQTHGVSSIFVRRRLCSECYFLRFLVDHRMY